MNDNTGGDRADRETGQIMQQRARHRAKRTARRQPPSMLGTAGVLLLALLLMGVALAGCGSSTGTTSTTGPAAAFDIDTAGWKAILAEAEGQTVTFYGWGGDENRNKWLDTTVAEALQSKYGVTLKRVPMDINDILTQLSGEIQAGTTEGAIDFIWINGENFYSAKEKGYLYGPFAGRLPNFTSYVDATSPDIAIDFGSPTEGYEAPYGKAQMVMLADTAVTPDLPGTAEEFLEFCKANQGRVTYPAAGDFTGTAFISCLIASAIGTDAWTEVAALTADDKEAIHALAEPGLAYLRSLNPYLWKEGTTFPADSGTVYTMFQDGELVLHMTYDPFGWVNDVEAGIIPETTRAFVFDQGTVGNTHFMAIAKNATHKAAAMVAINEIMSPEMQLSQYETLKSVAVLDLSKVDADTKSKFDAVDLGTGTIPLADLLDRRLPEVSGGVLTYLEQLWTEEVVGK